VGRRSDAGRAQWQRVLVQRAVENAFIVMVAPSASYTDVAVAVQCTPMAGRDDASGGIIVRVTEGLASVVRANALEDHVRLDASDCGRHQWATARGPPPTLGQWQTIRVVAVREPIQASRNDVRLLEHRDARSGAGSVGLWTKADAVTAFDDLVIRGVPGSAEAT
jgi:hypothetical protein